MSTITTAASSRYLLGTEDSERARLLWHCEIHRGQAERLLARLDVRAGARVLDLGCGPWCVLARLSATAGAGGEALGLDNKAETIAHAQHAIAERGLSNVRLVLGATTAIELATGSPDSAHERPALNQPPPAATGGGEHGAYGRPAFRRPT
ncbi:MAG: methyltransferase domain-containing protein [Solirubrobacterales bacterium]|nr:methyltransferase domain-containing protein [Solirubrobacterales bacterium]